MDARYLQVVSLNVKHNHAVAEHLFNLLPKRRRLNEIERDQVITILKSKPNKKILLSHIKDSYGKTVTLKDLHNMEAKARNANDKSSLEEMLSNVNNEPGTNFYDFQ